MDELLFSERGSLRDTLNERRNHLKSEVAEHTADYLLKVSETDLEEYLCEKYSLEPIIILEDEIHQMEPEDTKIPIQHRHHGGILLNGTAFTIVLPFRGDSILFHCQPSGFSPAGPPRGEVYEDKIILTIKITEPDERKLRQRFNQELDDFYRYVNWVNRDVKQFNEKLRDYISRTVSQRREKLLSDRKLSQALGVPMVRRDDAPKTYTVPEIRRKPHIVRPSVVTDVPFSPEPELDHKEYRNILNIMRNMTQVMEQSPRAFAEMREEDLRTHFLVQLNGQYEGKATGETFNFQGKTDILIREQGRNIFIAECKFWKGPKGLTETIDQLLDYLSWRDTKTAILLFSRNRNFTSVLGKIPGTAEEHPCYKRTESPHGETEFRYVFHQPGDPNREIILTILTFDIPRIDETEETL